MAKKYRFKVNTPWGSYGDIIDAYIPGTQAHAGNYLHLFDPIEGKSDVDRVKEWLMNEKKRIGYNGLNYHLVMGEIAQKLLSAGLNVDKLEGVGK